MFLFNKTDLKCICTVFYPPVGPLTQVPYDQTFPVYLSSNPNSNPVVLKHLAVRGGKSKPLMVEPQHLINDIHVFL